MKKSASFIFVCFVLMSVLVPSIVSGSVSDVFGRITGNVVADFGCSDSDGGIVYLEMGIVTEGDNSVVDYCLDESNLVEYYCDNNGEIGKNMYHGSCSEGALILSEEVELFKENVGALVLSDVYSDNDCGIVDFGGHCEMWTGRYDYPAEK